MKVSSYAVARPAYYDRSAASAVAYYAANVAPHLITTRWTTTVAAGKKQFVEFGRTSIYRSALATTAGLYESNISIAGISLTSSVANSVTVGTLVALTVTGAITLYAGDSIIGTTVDESVGGTVFFIAGYRATEFAA